MFNLKNARTPLMAAMIFGTLGLSACTSIGYRCPLEGDEDAEYPTACSSMQDAMAGARKGTGGKTSVLMDDKGRLVPPELLDNRVAKPLSSQASREPYREKSGDPVFHQPKVFQVWSSAFVDAEGNLHDGHASWFSTPGRWAYGTVDKPGVVGNNTMRPALPDARPAGRVVTVDQAGRPLAQQPQAQAAPAQSTQQARDKEALQQLSSAANSAAANAKAPAQAASARAPAAAAPGVTAPAVQLAD